MSVIRIKEVEGYVRDTIPDDDETIYDGIEFVVKNMVEVRIYKRTPSECPLHRGNWICDIKFTDGQMICFKVPLDMTVEQIRRYFKPLIDDFEALYRSKLN